ncbi:MAG: hypothetical protein H6657_20110 [Ardenticatenaceae bacterium]|nr:hypothetical protein [Ardenticatenaceae bacterium]
MKRLKLGMLLILLTILAAVACNGPINEPDATAVPPQPTEDNQPIRLTPITTPAVETVPTTDASPVIEEVPEAIMTAVFDDLMATTAVTQESIAVIQAEAVVWNDGSLGCPQPGEVYTMMPVAGYQIMLEANGRTYDYHAADTGYVVLCENALPQSPAVGTPTS